MEVKDRHSGLNVASVSKSRVYPDKSVRIKQQSVARKLNDRIRGKLQPYIVSPYDLLASTVKKLTAIYSTTKP